MTKVLETQVVSNLRELNTALDSMVFGVHPLTAMADVNVKGATGEPLRVNLLQCDPSLLLLHGRIMHCKHSPHAVHFGA